MAIFQSNPHDASLLHIPLACALYRHVFHAAKFLGVQYLVLCPEAMEFVSNMLPVLQSWDEVVCERRCTGIRPRSWAISYWIFYHSPVAL